MIDFRAYLNECLSGVPAITGDPGATDIYEVRDSVNFVLSDITDLESSPEVAYERVRGILQDLRYLIPPSSSHADMFIDGYGEAIIPLTHADAAMPVFLYFAYASEDDTENYEILAEIVDEEELEEILNGNTNIEPV